MTPDEFVRRAIGIPWCRWRSDFRAMDCFGLIVLWYREVLGIELGEVPHTDIATGFIALRPGWAESDPEPGCTGFMTWRDGAPTHCGVLLHGGQLLHSQAGHPIPEHGSVRLTRLTVMQRLAPDIRYYRYTPPC